MNRLGLASSDIDCFARQLAKARHLQLTGVFTHFASSGVFSDTPLGRQTRAQEELFYAALTRLRALGIDPGIVHLANSAAIVARPETWADMVRPGAILYGYHPGYDPAEQRAEIEKRLPLEPVMSLRARIISLRDVPAGAGVGYDSTFVPQRPSRIAVLAAGYGDGIHRSLGNRGSVLIRGVRAPMVGIVSMDVTMIDVTNVPGVEIGDTATIYGTDGKFTIRASQVATQPRNIPQTCYARSASAFRESTCVEFTCAESSCIAFTYVIRNSNRGHSLFNITGVEFILTCW